MDILFLNHLQSQCGVYNYGKRLFNIWKKSAKYNFNYIEIGSLDDYNKINVTNYKCIFYNYHGCTMPWLNSDTINKTKINIGILHECMPDFFTYYFDIATIPRPIFELIPDTISSINLDIIHFLNYGTDSNIPIIGSFGFGFDNKGFDKIIKYVNDEFDEAIIKIIMPFADFGDREGIMAQKVKKLCEENNKKQGIKILIIHNFLDDNDILYFLSKNTINMFLYDYMMGRGLSSTIDFAMSVNTPICISNSYMFRHIYNDNICINNQTIKNCISNGKNYVNSLKQKYSYQTTIRFIELFLNSI